MTERRIPYDRSSAIVPSAMLSSVAQGRDLSSMSTTMVCRVFPHEDADGPANMARDEALLDLVAGDPSATAFRTYGWSEPTLSLGYFQSIAEAEADPRWHGASIVRRPTGGGALWHDREVTYALVVPRDHPLARQSTALYRAVHEAIAGVLAGDEIGATRRGEPANGPEADAEARPRPFLCFADRDAEDLVIGSHKVVGSAQRRRAGAVLQHGALLLAASPRTPELPGVGELSPATAEPRVWADRLARSLPAALEMRPEPADWPEAWRARSRELEEMIYRNPAWTRRR
jgi:lipoate-protein ligase A